MLTQRFYIRGKHLGLLLYTPELHMSMLTLPPPTLYSIPFPTYSTHHKISFIRRLPNPPLISHRPLAQQTNQVPSQIHTPPRHKLQIEEIISITHRSTKDQYGAIHSAVVYKVKWQGYPKSENTMEQTPQQRHSKFHTKDMW